MRPNRNNDWLSQEQNNSQWWRIFKIVNHVIMAQRPCTYVNPFYELMLYIINYFIGPLIIVYLNLLSQ